MPIIRAGPFASSSDSSLNEPDSADRFILPVNCALSDSSTWPWKIYVDVRESTAASRKVSVKEYTENLTQKAIGGAYNTGSTIIYEAELELRFTYQAVSDFSFAAGSEIALEWDFSGSNFPDWSYSVQVDGADVAEDSGKGLVPGTERFDLSSLVFPATVVPIFVNIFAKSSVAISTDIDYAGAATAGITLIR